ncbi:selenocysteine-specific elongation factor [Motilibacter peucedani]|uniref:Selenocysteine-specific elongation factor n=1 Tax=Motilibacter peucedani TaxID=598650 RepID=A0A420XV33_9ACTN|nr:selenocysteine-specific translation elongation factor [Motilibacter peucedani]RKS80519.1 selenocysteine-specific elongation factor [Motilibacter peucedani]
MRVVATAGHVDHGKSTLVRALTGMEPDRWAEERRRGMTIDLGYAWTTLPDGETVSFVDVPGHQRFLGNMLAGLGPAPAVMFVVAADEGWRRQSTEHLSAVDALGVEHGLLAVTRSDLADPGPATREALEHLAASSLGSVEAVAVSGATGAGLDELRAALARTVARLPSPDTTAPVRLWLDRAFTVRGAGTVVTGTLAAGRVAVGDELELGGRTYAVRGLQSLGETRTSVEAVARVALNLRGLEHDDARRGMAVLTPGAWRLATELDVRLTVPAAELPGELMLHAGTAAVPVHVRPLGNDVARLRLAHPLPLRAGDRALLRDPGEHRVAAGVSVLDAEPPVLRRRGAAASRATALSQGTPHFVAEVARRGWLKRSDAEALGIVPVEDASVLELGEWYVMGSALAAWRDQLVARVREHQRSRPLEPGLPEGEAARGLPDRALLPVVVGAAGLERAAGRVRTPGYQPSLGPAEDAVRRLEERLRAHPFDAPEVPELAALRLGQRELAAAETAGRLLRVGGDVVLLPDGPARAMRVLAGLEQPFTTSTARQALGVSRRVAVPLLEWLDARGWTRRGEGGVRQVAR